MATDVNISSYSGSVVAGDWSPAFLAAWAALVAGGTIRLDQDVTIKSRMDFSGYFNCNILGNGGAKITVAASDTTDNSPLFNFGNMGQVKFSRINFIGKTGQPAGADCYQLIAAGFTEQLWVDHCKFAGILPQGAPYNFGGIICAGTGSEALVTNSKFGGCGGDHIYANGANSLVTKNLVFTDYQQIGAAYYDRQASRSWIRAENAAAIYSSRIILENVFMDEGGGWSVTDYNSLSVLGNGHNVGSGGVFTRVRNGSFKNLWYGYDTVADKTALRFVNCGDTEIDGLFVSDNVKRIQVDKYTRLRLVNSPGVIIDRI